MQRLLDPIFAYFDRHSMSLCTIHV